MYSSTFDFDAAHMHSYIKRALAICLTLGVVLIALSILGFSLNRFLILFLIPGMFFLFFALEGLIVYLIKRKKTLESITFGDDAVIINGESFDNASLSTISFGRAFWPNYLLPVFSLSMEVYGQNGKVIASYWCGSSWDQSTREKRNVLARYISINGKALIDQSVYREQVKMATADTSASGSEVRFHFERSIIIKQFFLELLIIPVFAGLLYLLAILQSGDYGFMFPAEFLKFAAAASFIMLPIDAVAFVIWMRKFASDIVFTEDAVIVNGETFYKAQISKMSLTNNSYNFGSLIRGGGVIFGIAYRGEIRHFYVGQFVNSKTAKDRQVLSGVIEEFNRS